MIPYTPSQLEVKQMASPAEQNSLTKTQEMGELVVTLSVHNVILIM